MMTPALLNGRYKVLKILASGGFGETFLAEDIQMPSKRKCVIKQLKPVEHNPQIYELVKERFQREAALLEELSDGINQIPHLYAYFNHDGQFYLVQEYIQGDTLGKKRRKEGRLNETFVKEILINILPVLEYIHAKRIVHRDIKPDNILIRSVDNQPVLIDFGAVKETMHTVMVVSENSTRSIVIGTPGFMPSEQTAGRPVYSSDLYSLGLTAIYLLTGKLPQELPTNPSTGDIIWKEFAPNISPDFAAILDKAIQSHPRERFLTAKEMLLALQPQKVQILPKVPKISLPLKNSAEPPTVISLPSSEVQNQPSTVLVNQGMKDWQKATIIGGVIGVCLVGGMTFINRQPTDILVRKTLAENKNNSSQNTTNLVQSPKSSITKEAALSVLNRWQDAKRQVFAPPFNQSLGAELTTGEAYRKNVGSGSSLEWLSNNNSYYRYGVQSIDSVEKFVASKDRATIEIIFTEDRKFYRNGKIVTGKNTSFDTRLVRYSLQLENGQLKISDYETINIISNR